MIAGVWMMVGVGGSVGCGDTHGGAVGFWWGAYIQEAIRAPWLSIIR